MIKRFYLLIYFLSLSSFLFSSFGFLNSIFVGISAGGAIGILFDKVAYRRNDELQYSKHRCECRQSLCKLLAVSTASYGAYRSSSDESVAPVLIAAPVITLAFMFQRKMSQNFNIYTLDHDYFAFELRKREPIYEQGFEN